MDAAAQCLLWDSDTPEEESEEGDINKCSCCLRYSQGTHAKKPHPLRVPILVLRAVCRNIVFRVCVRVLCLCIAGVIIFVGVKKKELCPFEPVIPIFLVVDGSFLVVHTALSLLVAWRKKRRNERKPRVPPDTERLDNVSILLKILVLFLTLWNLAGSVWIYSAEKVVQFQDSVRTDYCDVTAYYFAFGLVTSAYVTVGMVIVLTLLTAMSVYIYRRCDKPRTAPEVDIPSNITHI